MAKITASAKGAKRYFATPERKKIGMKTIQIHIVETSAGVAISPAPSRIASNTGLPWARCRSMFSIVTVASSTRIPTANARPPKVMMLIVYPSALRAAIEERMAKGIEMAMISVPPTARAIEIDRLGLLGLTIFWIPTSPLTVSAIPGFNAGAKVLVWIYLTGVLCHLLADTGSRQGCSIFLPCQCGQLGQCRCHWYTRRLSLKWYRTGEFSEAVCLFLFCGVCAAIAAWRWKNHLDFA